MTISAILKNWGIVFTGNFLGAFTVAVLMAIVFTNGFATEPSKVGHAIGVISESKRFFYPDADHHNSAEFSINNQQSTINNQIVDCD